MGRSAHGREGEAPPSRTESAVNCTTERNTRFTRMFGVRASHDPLPFRLTFSPLLTPLGSHSPTSSRQGDFVQVRKRFYFLKMLFCVV